MLISTTVIQKTNSTICISNKSLSYKESIGGCCILIPLSYKEIYTKRSKYHGDTTFLLGDMGPHIMEVQLTHLPIMQFLPAISHSCKRRRERDVTILVHGELTQAQHMCKLCTCMKHVTVSNNSHMPL